MYQVKFTTTFKKSYKLMKKRGLDISLLDEVIDLLRQGKQLDEKYKDHALSGNFIGFRECHIKPDWLLVYLLENDILTLTLVDTGTHSDIFRYYSKKQKAGYFVFCFLFVFVHLTHTSVPVLGQCLFIMTLLTKALPIISVPE